MNFTKFDIDRDFEMAVVNQYIPKVVNEEFISKLTKLIRKQARQLAEQVAYEMDIQIIIRKDLNTLATRIRKKV